MSVRASWIAVAAFALPLLAPAARAQSNPVATAFREQEASAAKDLVGGAEAMPASKYGYKPTAAQMSFGQIVVHLSGGNDYFCSALTGQKAPTRTKVAPTDSKDVLVARLKETFDFCNTALDGLTDAGLGEELPFFGGRKVSRASMEFTVVGDWSDHYSQMANYLRLNGVLPPTAKK